MPTAEMKHHTKVNPDEILAQVFAQVFHAYMECDTEIQDSIKKMVKIVNSEEATEEERDSALDTIMEALFPQHLHGGLGVDLNMIKEHHEEEEKAALRLDHQEMTFAEKVNKLLQAKGMTQSDLATQIGVGQPAVSMMLARECRPQRRTIEKIAKVLEVTPVDLWPID